MFVRVEGGEQCETSVGLQAPGHIFLWKYVPRETVSFHTFPPEYEFFFLSSFAISQSFTLPTMSTHAFPYCVCVFAIVHLFYNFLLVLSTGHDVWWFGVCNRVASCKCLTWVQKPWRHASMHTMTPSGLSAWPQKTRWVCCEFQVSVHMEHS